MYIGAVEGWEAPIVATQPGHYAVFGDDAQLNVRFVKFPVINESETEKLGYKVLEYKTFVRIQRVGDKLSVYFQEARPKDKARFARQYEVFQSGKMELMGTPLEHWDFHLSETDRLTFHTLGIHYVHQIAAMTDVQQRSLGIDAKRIVSRARIDVAEQVTKEANSELQEQLDATKKMLEEQQAELAQFKRILEAKSYEKEKEEGREGRRLQIEPDETEKPKRPRSRRAH